MEHPDRATEGPHDEELGEAAGVETADATSGMAALFAVLNATMLLSWAVGLITGLMFGVVIGRRTAAPPSPPWRRFRQ